MDQWTLIYYPSRKRMEVYVLNGFKQTDKGMVCYWSKSYAHRFNVPQDDDTFDPEKFRIISQLRDHLIATGRFAEQHLLICHH